MVPVGKNKKNKIEAKIEDPKKKSEKQIRAIKLMFKLILIHCRPLLIWNIILAGPVDL